MSRILMFSLLIAACIISVKGQLKQVTTYDDFCKICRHINAEKPANEYEAIRDMGFDPDSYTTYGFMHPQAVSSCMLNINTAQHPSEQPYRVTGFSWQLFNPTQRTDERWVDIRLSNIKLITKNSASAIITLRNNKSVFLQLASGGGSGYSTSLPNGLLLYPKEEITCKDQLVFPVDCSSGSAESTVFDFVFSRGEFTGCSMQEFITRVGISASLPVVLKPLAFYGLRIGFSNLAVYYSVINIYWTAITGEWLKRDQIENSISLMNSYDLLPKCRECGTIWEEAGFTDIMPEYITILYKRNIDPQTALSLLFKTYLALLKNPLTRDIAFEIAKKSLPEILTKGGAAALEANLSIIISGAWRAAALLPIAWDVWNTNSVNNSSGVLIKPECSSGK